MNKHLALVKVTAILLTAFTTLAMADFVEFTNGDKLTGKITGITGGKLHITTAVAGKVSVNISDVKTFQTDTPAEIHMLDDSVINHPISQGDAGHIKLPGPKKADRKAVPISEIKAINPPKAKWDVSISVGAAATRGNSEGESVNISVDAKRNTKFDRIKFSGGYDFSRQEDSDTGDYSTSEDNWFAFGQYDHFFSKSFYSYINTRIEKDRLANLDLRVRPGVGGGLQWVRTDKVNLSSEAGLSYVHEDYRDPDRKEDFTAARLAYDFDYKLNSIAKFTHGTEYLPSTEDSATFLVNTNAGLRVKINSYMFTEFKVLLDYNSQPSGDDKKIDTKYLMNIGLNF